MKTCLAAAATVPMNPRAVAYAFVAVLLLVSAVPINAQNMQPASQHWHDDANGISLELPEDVVPIAAPRQDVLGTFSKKNVYNITVYLRTQIAEGDKVIHRRDLKNNEAFKEMGPNQVVVTREMTISDILTLATQQMGNRYLQFVKIEENPFTVGDKKGAWVYYQIPDTERGDFIIGQCFVLLDASTTLVIRIETDKINFKQIKPEFEKMLRSLQFTDPQILEEQRREWMNNGELWYESLKYTTLKTKLNRERWLRIVDEGKDIGYQCLREAEDRELNLNGIRIEEYTWIQGRSDDFQQEAWWFMDENNSRELWDVKKYQVTKKNQKPGFARRTKDQKPASEPGMPRHAWAESGIRHGVETKPGQVSKIIHVTRESPTGIEQAQWEQPASHVYLSQAELQLIRRHLPGTLRRQYAFYAYSSDRGQISFHTERVEPGPGGSYRVFSRANLSMPETVHHYDNAGNLIKYILPTGREFIVSTPAKIRAIWQLR